MKNRTIKETKEALANITNENDPFMLEILSDDRKGVQQLIFNWRKKQMKRSLLIKQFTEMMYHENYARHLGFARIAGIDEVGRGPLAGPVVAACVILPEKFQLLGLTDSKKLSKTKREDYFKYILSEALSVGIGQASSREIDEINIYQASKQAMVRAVEKLSISPDYLLVDAMELPIDLPQEGLIKGDARSNSIAASSVIAKVTRDRYMESLHKAYPEYGFNQHMGYGTKAHINAIETHGIINEHRKSFSPVSDLL